VSPDENFRRELNNVFDDVSGSPSPALRDRVRSAIAEAPAERSTYWIAAVAACVITALIVGILYVNNPFRRGGFVGPGPTPSSSISPSAQPSPTPSPSPTPVYVCTATTMPHTLPTGSPIAYVSDARVAPHDKDGYERVVIEFSNGIPTKSVELRPQTGTSFPLGESGQDVKLKGTNGIHVVIDGADMHTSYQGQQDWMTGYAKLAEVRVVEDFEGVIRIGLGINGPACYTATYYTNPTRLVIDIQAP
jgi:hypothetical protein